MSLARSVAIGLILVALWPGAWSIPAPSAIRTEVLVDRVRIEKASRTLILFSGDEVLKTYHVSLGRHPAGRKETRGDGRTPEGRYIIDGRNANSRFHLALHISYPDDNDRARAKALGTDPGGEIMIHGLTNGLGWLGRLHRLVDWTNGCIAVTNAEIEEIWGLVPDGTAVEIVP